MTLVTMAPVAPLSNLVETIWDWDSSAAPFKMERVLPSAQARIIIQLADEESRFYDDALVCQHHAAATFVAPCDRSFLIDNAGQARVVGIVFRPGGAAPYFRECMDIIANSPVDLDAMTGDATHGLRFRLMEARNARARLHIVQDWLLAHALETRREPAISCALSLLAQVPEVQRIGAIADHCGLSPRRFGQLFREQVGMSPKRYARLQRFRRVMVHAHESGTVDWAGVAADTGFYDQPHLVREFRAFCGVTPGAYVADRSLWPDHVPLK